MAFANSIAGLTAYRYIVNGPNNAGPLATINEAITQAFADGYGPTNPVGIFVTPGTYTENLVFDGGINIIGTTDGTVNIIGSHTPPLVGTVGIFNCTLSSATDLFANVAASPANITIQSCIFNINGIIFNLPNWTGILTIANCTDISTVCSLVSNAIGAAAVNISYSQVGIAGGCSFSGVTRIENSHISNDLLCIQNANVTITNCVIFGQITSVFDSRLSIYNSFINSPVHTCILTSSTETVILKNVALYTIDTYAIGGTGTVEFGSITFDGTFAIDPRITASNLSLFTAANLNILRTLSLNADQGTAGQVITSQGAGAMPPIWADQPAGGLAWTPVAVDTPVVKNHFYSNQQNGVETVFTLPTTADSVAGDTFAVMNNTSYGVVSFRIAQNASQTIYFGNQTTTLGVTGYLESTLTTDSVTLKCNFSDGVTTATWTVVEVIGNIEVV